MNSLPDFYDAARVSELYTPDAGRAVEAGRKTSWAPASDDISRTALLLIDIQNDFVHPEGSLSIPGAVDDTRRIIEWIYQYGSGVNSIIASLDSHLPLQIFSPAWWEDESGAHPSPYTIIRSDEISAQKWRPVYEAAWSHTYVEKLEEYARKDLMIWPYHTLIGTSGQNMVPALYEAVAFHASARRNQPQFVSKGAIARTENYSIFEPEVKVDELQDGGLNVALLESLKGFDRIYVAGQAKSHCVLETVTSMVRYFGDQPDIIQRIHLLEDAMSSVQHPEIDFEALANDTFARYQELGIRITNTADALS